MHTERGFEGGLETNSYGAAPTSTRRTPEEIAFFLAIPTAPLHVTRTVIKTLIKSAMKPNPDREPPHSIKDYQTYTTFKKAPKIIARGLTGAAEGAGLYGLTYGLAILASTKFIEPYGLILQVAVTVIAGIWFGNGRSWSGIISGALVGGIAVVIHNFAVSFLINRFALSVVDAHLIGGITSIVAVLFVEGFSAIVSYNTFSIKNGELRILKDRSFEFDLHAKVVQIVGNICRWLSAEYNSSTVYYDYDPVARRVSSRQETPAPTDREIERVASHSSGEEGSGSNRGDGAASGDEGPPATDQTWVSRTSQEEPESGRSRGDGNRRSSFHDTITRSMSGNSSDTET